jgi:hypothetical protein
MPTAWTPGRSARRQRLAGCSSRWRHLLGKAARGAHAAYVLILLEERYPASGPRREEAERKAVREARNAAAAALLFLKEGGTVPSYLEDLKDRAVREREREVYRHHARRAVLSLSPQEDRGLRLKRALGRVARGLPPREEPEEAPGAAAGPSRDFSKSISRKDLVAEAADLLSLGMARLSLSCFPDPDLRSALAPAALAAHRVEVTLILDQVAGGLESFVEVFRTSPSA